MKNWQVINSNLRFYKRYYVFVALASLMTVASIVGSLMVGDSVRMTLVKRVTDRLGKTESIIYSRTGYIDETILQLPVFQFGCQGVIMTDGFIADHGRLIPVTVWGIDQLASGITVEEGTSKINVPLSKELENSKDDIVLRLANNGMVPSGSLFVTQSYTTSIRLGCEGVISASEGGNISLKNEQVLPLNVFVNRTELAELLGVDHKVNMILAEQMISYEEINDLWNNDLAGIHVETVGSVREITTDRVFMQQELVSKLSGQNQRPNRLYSYLANSMSLNDISIPYSFVTALDRYGEYDLADDEILLSDYAAHRLHAKVGDRVNVTYYKMKGLKKLETDSVLLRVAAVIPLQDFVDDGHLSADFPGLSDVERCTDWDSDLPIDMKLITDEDEQYWTDYRSTPKALVPYKTVAGDWETVFGTATALRVDDLNPDLSGLHASMFGVQVVHPRESGLFGAMNGVDFSGLFLALGFFIIVSALLLMYSPLSEMYAKRTAEINLLKSLGYSSHRITSLLWREALPIVLIASLIGVLFGLLYTAVIMYLLGNVWQGATQTDGFGVYANMLTLCIGTLVSVALSLGLLRWTIGKAIADKPVVDQNNTSKRRLFVWLVFLGILTLLVLLINIFYQSIILFVITGCMWIALATVAGFYLLVVRGLSPQVTERMQLVWSSLYAVRKQAVASFLPLVLGVFIVFAVGLNRRSFADSSQLGQGTGGYALLMETSVPVYYDINTPEGKKQLSLTELPADAHILQFLRYSADDASCLNLNKVSTPTVLGVDMEQFTQSFSVDYYAGYDLQRLKNDVSAYPVLVDETVLTWGLMKSMGDTLYYTDAHDNEVKLLIAGTLPNTVLQGNVVMDKGLFAKIWPELTGSQVALVRVNKTNVKQTAQLIAIALNEYGVRVNTTNERLKQFYQVTDTYLTIFLSLGGIGLLLGILSFLIVIRKNLTARSSDIRMYAMIGYRPETISQLLFKENVIVPVFAIVVGVTGALLSIGTGFANVSVSIWLLSLLLMLLLAGCVWAFVKRLVIKEVKDKYQ